MRWMWLRFARMKASGLFTSWAMPAARVPAVSRRWVRRSRRSKRPRRKTGGDQKTQSIAVDFAQGTPSGGMVTVTATISGTVIPDKLFVDVEVTQP